MRTFGQIFFKNSSKMTIIQHYGMLQALEKYVQEQNNEIQSLPQGYHGRRTEISSLSDNT
jgi:hypothetical protein